MGLRVPLYPEQVAAACRLHSNLAQWQASESALMELVRRFPEFCPEACLLKTAAVNALYATNVFAIVRMARHIERVLASTDIPSAGPELVERIAALPDKDGGKPKRNHISFASKFAHFFIDPERFPLCDQYAAAMLQHHLRGMSRTTKDTGSYTRYAADFRLVRSLAGLTCTTRELDRYLWLAGLYRHWLRKPSAKINVEVASLFRNPPAASKADLNVLLPPDPGMTIGGDT
jgi:hypothetical protein